jgi:hypothetical protein
MCITSYPKKTKKKSFTSFSLDGNPSVLVCFIVDFSLFGSWNGGGVLVVMGGGFAKRKGGGKSGGRAGWAWAGLGWVGLVRSGGRVLGWYGGIHTRGIAKSHITLVVWIYMHI